MNSHQSYGVIRQNVVLYGAGDQSSSRSSALPGQILRVERLLSDDNVAVHFLDKAGRGIAWEAPAYQCRISDYVEISEQLMMVLLGVQGMAERAQLAQDRARCDFLVDLEIGEGVRVLYTDIWVPGTVCYVGPVEGMNPGYYFGLKLQIPEPTTSCNGSHGGCEYFLCAHGYGLFVSAEKVRPKDYDAKESILADVHYPEDGIAAKNVDLIDLFTGQWSGGPPILESVRNKSLNPISHLVSTRKLKLVPPKVLPPPQQQQPLPPPPPPPKQMKDDDELGVGTVVEVVAEDGPIYGVVRHSDPASSLVGVELEEEHPAGTDGSRDGKKFFQCSPGRGLFVDRAKCRPDARFLDLVDRPEERRDNAPADDDDYSIPGVLAPLSMPAEEDVLAVCGKYRGIQGHHNSCYLDATLFAMFTFTSAFDGIIYRPKGPGDISRYEEVQKVLREEIVNPLRSKLFVKAEHVMRLRRLMDELSSVSGLTTEEKDPEEFLNSLLAQVLRAEPFLKLSSGQDAYYHQLFVDKDEDLELPTVQQLFEQSFISSGIRLNEAPGCLIVQMPRFGKNYRMYPRILPSQLLDITDLVVNSPRQCTVCGRLAKFECKDCFGECGEGLESTGFCAACLSKVHSHARRSNHRPTPLSIPADFADLCPRPPRLYMELFAVVCIETSHYVAFVKCGSGLDAPWCFFDSMADRQGERDGYNIPEMVACPDVSRWLADEGAATKQLHKHAPHDRQLPEHAKRLLCDAYICMYQSPDVVMYS